METVYLNALLSTVAVLLSLVVWIGRRIIYKLDEITKSFGTMKEDMIDDLNSLDKRLSLLEQTAVRGVCHE